MLRSSDGFVVLHVLMLGVQAESRNKSDFLFMVSRTKVIDHLPASRVRRWLRFSVYFDLFIIDKVALLFVLICIRHLHIFTAALTHPAISS